MADTTPTLAGFQAFLIGTAGMSAAVLPSNSPVVSDAFQVATEIVNQTINSASPTLYTQALYNLGADYCANFAPDQAGQTFFATLRTTLGLNSFVGGVISSTGDEGTNQSMVVPEAAQNFTMANLQQLKSPWGRVYMGIAQSYGKSTWGLT